MVRKINWDRQFGRRLKLRDLHVFFTVVQAALQKGAWCCTIIRNAHYLLIGEACHNLIRDAPHR
jgi:hypothetical protein